VQTFLTPTANNAYSTLKNGKVYIFEPQKNWKDALNLIGKQFKDFRGSNQNRIADTPNFGFPIVHGTNQRSTMLKKTTMQGGRIIQHGTIDEINRRASPLLFKVVQTTNNDFFPVIIWLNGDLLPSGYEIMDKKGDYNKLPDPKIIQDFINTLSPKCMVNL
jgi:CRISPR/Cas system CMR-associated protein Cmr1 (group 7 of RAMP superfamily)